MAYMQPILQQKCRLTRLTWQWESEKMDSGYGKIADLC